jgi:hypothetical protein
VGLKIFCGDASETLHEFEQLLEIKSLLESADDQGPIYMITNFRLANGEVDCLILRPEGPVILELKSFEGEIHGDENSDWYVKSKEDKQVPLHGNLFKQMGRQRFDFKDKLQKIGEKCFPHIEQDDLKKVSVWGYFRAGSNYPEGQINLRRVPWFDIVTKGSLLYKLKFAKTGYTFSKKDMDHIVAELHVKECAFEDLQKNSSSPPTTQQSPISPENEAVLITQIGELPPRIRSLNNSKRIVQYKKSCAGYSGKYVRLICFLESCPTNEITLTYNEILEIIQTDLPPSAYKWTMWWQNSEQTHVSVWTTLGWSASRIRLGERITFKKSDKILYIGNS